MLQCLILTKNNYINKISVHYIFCNDWPFLTVENFVHIITLYIHWILFTENTFLPPDWGDSLSAMPCQIYTTNQEFREKKGLNGLW